MASVGAPLSIEDIVEQAANFQYNVHIPLRYWLRTADTMQKEAQVYEAEGNNVQAYLLLYRHAQLVLNHLEQHPEVKLPENKKGMALARAAVNGDLTQLEVLAPHIRKRHAEFLERRRVQQEALESLEGRGERLPQELDGLSLHPGASGRRPYEKTKLDAGEHRSLAAKLAQREVRRRDAARRSVRQAGVSEEQEQERRTGGVWGEWEKELRRESDEVDDDLSRQIQEVARMQNGHMPPNFSRPTSYQSPTSPYHYPAVPHKAQERWSGSDSRLPSQGTAPARPPKELLRRPSDSSTRPPALPPKPPKPLTSSLPFENPRPPPIPGKYRDAEPTPPPLPGKYHAHSSVSTLRPSSPSASSKEDLDEFLFKPSAYLENGEPLRTVFLPNTLRQAFLSCASKNTRLNLETCGILCGILKSNALFITRLVIPEQTSTSDTCETVNESELFDYCDKEELMVLGWIHTHPTQTCFMSSRDLHTHVGYQVMMPESIAIVCAPSKEPSWGTFRLTDPPGKNVILNCNQPGIFHPHSVDNIYTDALNPGHVVELPQAPLEVVDMRPKI
ncbi:STAM binding protein [Lindgomyces ingoldianus]|uniref:STAM binding protein n=1 Tax=Lindgomyces ingoldianus TaxID=673940 RepID=A0ACB6QHY9_9PLEO|nr:STAM binding protein [Lindgomyces ingoldianus]KAF2466496.1 STAM binding protein [Lindgomyces ingoldianus]